MINRARSLWSRCRRTAEVGQWSSVGRLGSISQHYSPRSFSTETPNVTTTQRSLYSPQDTSKPFFVTTPIFYVNASPHIGHLHSLVLTDIFARYAKFRNPQRKVFFSTGTDEHGLKIQQAAKAQGVEEEEFCAKVSQRFRELADKANIGYTDFIRTAEQRHYNAVEHFWDRLVESGDIYKGKHSGWYSISDECFYTELQVGKDESGEMVSLETGNKVTWEEEENWKFRLPKYKTELVSWASQSDAIHPDTMQSYVIGNMENLDDLAISRPRNRVKWGVPVPRDPDQTIYVWVDALINYLTVLGYPNTSDGWPADIHVVGKDIIRFHAIHWPALLMAAKHTPPKTVLSHAHWTMGKFKMSKSKGNVVDPISLMETYGPDPIRWYLMSNGGSLPTDVDFSLEQLNTNYSVSCARLGNLLNRITSGSIVRNIGIGSENLVDSVEFDLALKGARDAFDGFMDKHQITRACGVVINLINLANKHFSESEPWKTGTDSSIPVFYSFHALRISGLLLQPFMPLKSVELLDRLGIPDSQRDWEHATFGGRESLDVDELKQSLERGLSQSKWGKQLFPVIKMTV